ncbi:DUF3097 domain-containing protein [Aeromicrobium wangtongii]|uniref:DUF3097 domain-containing protein n=1 Tax=Aeromicrobium wangtongii TaxID=2969247 RepID=A0ABY5MDR1_9ACTN|nr:DUF3097 domain-containing protein [Aeromicrobium wangtongii]MCD9197324.1 DUF3097 domain-containing protein [Aeromicrobium wangtongii]UUP14818.1 DUF3097 domain-containing protein [Aeromicrobium wangtongii]
MADRYGSDVLSGDWKKPKRGRSEEVVVERGMVVEDATTGFCGEVMVVEKDLGMMILEDRRLVRRSFPLGPGYLLEGKPVVLRPPSAATKALAKRTASGSRAVHGARARVALPSRIYVEGRHDAELVERVWGDDLRIEGVAVEYLGGIDDLAAIVDEFGPTAERRLGVLVDHLVPGSKETRIAEQVSGRPHVLVVGHPYIDVWQSVKPARLGVERWPVIPRGQDWKYGICREMGWPHKDQTDIANAWKHILSKVDSYTDLEPEFLGRVEELIDFVTAPV